MEMISLICTKNFSKLVCMKNCWS